MRDEACSRPEFVERNSSILASAASNFIENNFLSWCSSSLAKISGITIPTLQNANTPAISNSKSNEITIAIPMADPARPENALSLFVDKVELSELRQYRKRFAATRTRIAVAIALSP